MSVFDAYGNYYNLLYKDKDYAGEVVYLKELTAEFMPLGQKCLNLGCGTGNHDFLLAEAGFNVLGVDLSDQMIEVASKVLEEKNVSNLKFQQGDIRTLKLNQSFDIVFAMFHVLSYLNSNQDIEAALASVQKHLEPGGIFIFDTWYGPAVLEQVPEKRTKEIEDDEVHVLRRASPVHHEDTHIVEVHYDLDITDKSNGEKHKITEQHNMRYFFDDELEDALKQNGFELIHREETSTKNPLSPDTWSSLFVARKQ